MFPIRASLCLDAVRDVGIRGGTIARMIVEGVAPGVGLTSDRRAPLP